MSCNDCNGVFFRQSETVIATSSDTTLEVVDFSPPMIPFSWWKTGRRLVFEVPITGVLQNRTTFGVRLHDNTASANFTLALFDILAGAEIESFRLVCDVVEVANSDVTVLCWIDFPFLSGLDPAPQPFIQTTFDMGFHPLLTQVFFEQSEDAELTLTFQNAQFTGMGQSAPLVC